MLVNISNKFNAKMLPIDELKLVFGSNTYTVKTILEGSEISIEPVTIENDRGGVDTVALKVIGKIDISSNNYQEIIGLLIDICTTSVVNINYTLLGLSPTSTNSGQMLINNVATRLSPTLAVEDHSVSWRISANNLFPVLTVETVSYFSMDILSTSSGTQNGLFIQNWTSTTL